MVILRGVKVGNDLVTWEELSEIIARSPSTIHMFATCFSANINIKNGNGKNKVIIGFEGLIDADLATETILTIHHVLLGEQEKALRYNIKLWKTYFKKLETNSFQFLDECPHDHFWYRDIKWDKYCDEVDRYVEYDHPCYKYYDITVNEEYTIQKSNFIAVHYGKDELDNVYVLDFILLTIAALLGIPEPLITKDYSCYFSNIRRFVDIFS